MGKNNLAGQCWKLYGIEQHQKCYIRQLVIIYNIIMLIEEILKRLLGGIEIILTLNEYN